MMSDTLENSDEIEAWQIDVQLAQAWTEQRHELVVPLAERLLELRDAKLGPTHEKSVTTLDYLITSLIKLGQWEPAEAFLERRYGPKNSRLVSLLVARAASAFTNGNVEEADEQALRALGLAREVGHSEDSVIATCHSILADLGYRRKAWDHALMHAVEAFRIRSSNLSMEPAYVFKDLMLVADIFFQLGEYEESCKSSRMAVEVAVGKLDSEPLKMAAALSLYGRAAMADDKPEGAVNPFKGALEFYERVFGETDVRLTDPLLELGKAYQAAEYFEEAEETFQRLLRLYQARYPDEKTNWAIPLSLLGDLARQAKDHARAATFFEEALALAVAEFGQDSLRLHVILDKAAEAHLAAENLERAEELSHWHIRVLLPHLPSKDEPALLPSVRRLADIQLRRLKEKRANEEELKEYVMWVTRLMEEAVKRVQAETEQIKARNRGGSAAS